MLNSKELLRYAWPMALASSGTIVVGITDTLVMGHYSTQSLAGVSLGATVYQLFLSPLLGGLMAYNILAPRIAGKGGKNRETLGLSIILRPLLPIALLAMVCMLMLAMALTYYAPDPVWLAAGDYLLGRAWSLPGVLMVSSLLITLTAWGFTRAPLVVFAVSSGVNLLLDIVLVYGFGPIPSLGALGDGLASTAGVFSILPWAIIKLRKSARPTQDRAAVLTQFKGWGKLSIPSVFSSLLDMCASTLFVLIISQAGAAALAGVRTGILIEVLAFVTVAALSNAGLILLGQLYGNNLHGLRFEMGSVRRKFLLISSLFGALFIVIAWPMGVLMSPDPQVSATAAITIAIVGVLCPVVGWCQANVTLLRALGKTGADFVSTVVAAWIVQLPTAALGLYLFGWLGAFAAIAAFWLARAVISQFQLRRIVRNDTIPEAAAS